jgi:hypothetical protein
VYDTVAGLFREVPRSVLDAVPWTRRQSVLTDERGQRDTYHGGRPGEVHVMLHPDGVFKFERSLPKALTGQNAEDLTQGDLPDAFAAVDRELYELIGGPGFPPISEADPARVDYCRSHDLEDPAMVDRALSLLSRRAVAWKGRAVVGESGSVAWPRGAMRPKFYNKGREDKNPDHLSLLRFEVGAYGIDTFRSMPGLMEAARAAGSAAPGLRLVDVLTPPARDHVFATVLERMGGIPVDVDDMSDIEFARTMVDFFGPRRAAALVGYCALWTLLGIRSAKDLDRDPVTWYRAMADLRRFRDHLRTLGRAPEDVADLATWIHGHMAPAA